MYVFIPPISSKDPAGVPVCLTAVQQSLVHAPLRGVSLAVEVVDMVGEEDQVVVGVVRFVGYVRGRECGSFEGRFNGRITRVSDDIERQSTIYTHTPLFILKAPFTSKGRGQRA